MIKDKTLGSRVFDIFNYALMIVLCIIFFAPLWHVVCGSISDPWDLTTHTGLLFKPVGKINLEGYKLVLKNPAIQLGYLNTIIYVAASTALGTIITIIAGYVLSRKELKLAKTLTAFIMFTLLFNGGTIPTYIVIKELGLIGTRWALIIPGCANAFYIAIMKSAFEQVPASLEESAKIDGAGPLTIMVKILVPLVQATIAVVVLFTVLIQWNSWFPASIYLSQNRELWPLQLVIREILVQQDTSTITSGADMNIQAELMKNQIKYCTAIVASSPIMCAYPFAQNYFIQGVTLGGVKG
jgi:putative aldouronate transport system permease protein